LPERNSCTQLAMENVMSKHHYILAASLALRCCWFQGKKESKYTVSSEQVLGSPDCALLFEVLTKKGIACQFAFTSDFNFTLYNTRFYSLSQPSAASEFI